jgi:hypothetical protein
MWRAWKRTVERLSQEKKEEGAAATHERSASAVGISVR